MAAKFETVDEYIASFPAAVQTELEAVRAAVHRGAPGCTEAISYGMAAFRLHDRTLVHVGGWKHHIGVYPVPADDPTLESQLAPYRSTKDALRLPLSGPVPVMMIEQVAAMLARRRATDAGAENPY
ncbi:MAG: hypothetical protein JWN62_3099 [Acidimicrobiales bacterium]|nr:hypothetical protein [Acidimicrobiales bacterium]